MASIHAHKLAPGDYSVMLNYMLNCLLDQVANVLIMWLTDKSKMKLILFQSKKCQLVNKGVDFLS